jgi:hypothetical protein
MPLILAIEPDRRQASQLQAVVRGRLHAELVLADSAELALANLGSRIPDLILTSALLSPKDETALGERLRALDGAAAHVQTLTIPVLATGKSRLDGGRGGVLSALRLGRGHLSASQGCDPAVFAEQCRGYLERAAAECERHAEEAALRAPAPVARVESDEEVEEVQSLESAPLASVEIEPGTVERASVPQAPVTVEAAPVEAAKGDTACFVETTPADLAQVVDAAPAEAAHVVDTAQMEAAHVVEEAVVERTQVVEQAPADEGSVQAAPSAEPPAQVADEPLEAIVPTAVVAEMVDAQAAPVASVPVDIPLATAAFEEVLREAERSEPLFHQFSCAPASLVEAVVALEASESLARQLETRQELEYEIVDLDLSDLLDEPDQTPARTSETSSIGRVDDVDAEPVEVYEIGDILMDFAAPMSTPEPPQPKVPSRKEEAALAPIAQEPLGTISETELYMPLPRAAAGNWPALEGFMDDVAALVALETAQPVLIASNTNNEPEDVAEWLDIIEALRRDAEPVPFKRPPAKRQFAPEPRAVEPAVAPITAMAPLPESAQPEASKKKRKRPQGGPVQDEWGIFDPEQCGFAALLAKLEEITDKEETRSPRPA